MRPWALIWQSVSSRRAGTNALLAVRALIPVKELRIAGQVIARATDFRKPAGE